MGGTIGGMSGNPELFVDNVHLSDAGNAVLADAVFRAIARTLQQSDIEASAAASGAMAVGGKYVQNASPTHSPKQNGDVPKTTWSIGGFMGAMG